MSEDLKGAVSLEDDVTLPVVDDEAEPEGTVEITPGRRMVDVSVVAAERKKARENTAKTIRETELAPLKAKADKADALEQALAAARPYVDLVKQNPGLLQPKPATPQEVQISDSDAEQEARDLQLYKPDSTLDIATAKKVIARRRDETKKAALEAAREVAAPLQQSTAEHASRQNFAAMCSLRDDDGHPLIDPESLAKEWVQLPPDLTQHQQVAETVLNAAIGKRHRTGPQKPKPVEREPLYSESPGGQRQAAITLTKLDRALGLTEKDHKAVADRFVPGGMSVIGE